MIPRLFKAALLLFPLLLLAGCDRLGSEHASDQTTASADVAVEPNAQTAAPQVTQALTAAALELQWDDLIPADFRLDTLMEKYDLDNLEDDDPLAAQALEELKAFWKEAPVVYDHNGKLIKLPGFVVPLDLNVDKMQEFLLVPYYGACIHTPPPPANQTVYVVTEEDNPFEGKMFDTVWVTGKLIVESIDSTYGSAGYRIEAAGVVPYE
ncbi:MAG: DUF3299 domain-containing protein [Pseudomonadota bacterium]